jgi:hydrogenase maturation protein HypF
LDDSTPAVFDWRRMIAEIMQDLACETPLPTMARKFHNTLIELIVAAASKCGEQRVVMSGGCFQNQLLLEGAIARLENEGFRPYWHQRVPPNDGGIALGQAVVAQHRTMDSSSCA